MAGEIVLLSIVFAGLYAGIRGIFQGFNLSPQARGARLVTCPESRKPAVMAVAAGAISREGFPILDRYRAGQCSLWPEMQNCGQSCLKQAGARAAH